jgi:hypothetical protein
MNMKKYIISLLIIFSTILVFPVGVFAAVNSGFIPGQIWYSKSTLVEGETVNIHTAVWNGEKDSLTVKVGFYDKNTLLGSRDVALASLELKDVYIPWKITAGDHIISAKITSSTSTVSGKKETVVLDRALTSNDRQFVAVSAKDNNVVTSAPGIDALKTQIDKTSAEINSIVPENVSNVIVDAFNSVDSVRDNTLTKVTVIKDETKKEVDSFKSESNTGQTTIQKTNIEDATKKPIAYIKLFLFSVLVFIFANKIVFYAVLLIIVFSIIRAVFRAIRNR